MWVCMCVRGVRGVRLCVCGVRVCVRARINICVHVCLCIGKKRVALFLLANVAPHLAQHTPTASASPGTYCAVLFADIVSFTTFSSQISAMPLVEILNEMFKKFDQKAKENYVDKIKTIGDCYVAASGLDCYGNIEDDIVRQTGKNHAVRMIDMAIDMHKCMQELNNEMGIRIRLRIGMHSGEVRTVDLHARARAHTHTHR